MNRVDPLGERPQRIRVRRRDELVDLLSRLGKQTDECAVRGRVSRRSLAAWIAQLATRDDRASAVGALRERLIEKVNEVELAGRREAA